MRKAHKLCPICNSELSANKYINTYCYLLDKRLSFITNVCSFCLNGYYQVESLYGDLYLERILDLEKSTSVIVDYVNVKSEFFSYLHGKDTIIASYNKIIDLDYPDLVKIKNKIKTLVLFI